MTDHTTAHKKVNILSPEKLLFKPSIYSVTINPNDKRQYWDCTDRILKLTEFVEQQLLTFPNSKLDLFMEVSRNGRLHFHGTIVFTTFQAIKDFYVLRIHDIQQWSNIDIDNLEDENVWMEYCTKSKHLIDVHISTDDCLNRYRKVKIDKKGVAHKPYFDPQ